MFHLHSVFMSLRLRWEVFTSEETAVQGRSGSLCVQHKHHKVAEFPAPPATFMPSEVATWVRFSVRVTPPPLHLRAKVLEAPVHSLALAPPILIAFLVLG